MQQPPLKHIYAQFVKKFDTQEGAVCEEVRTLRDQIELKLPPVQNQRAKVVELKSRINSIKQENQRISQTNTDPEILKILETIKLLRQQVQTKQTNLSEINQKLNETNQKQQETKTKITKDTQKYDLEIKRIKENCEKFAELLKIDADCNGDELFLKFDDEEVVSRPIKIKRSQNEIIVEEFNLRFSKRDLGGLLVELRNQFRRKDALFK